MKHGSLERLHVQIPLNLLKYPVVVTIEGLFILAGPSQSGRGIEVDAQEAERREKSIKRKQVLVLSFYAVTLIMALFSVLFLLLALLVF